MIFYKIKYHRPLLEKMPTAFFNISRSNSASFNFASKSLMIFCSGVCFKVPLPGKLLVPNVS